MRPRWLVLLVCLTFSGHVAAQLPAERLEWRIHVGGSEAGSSKMEFLATVVVGLFATDRPVPWRAEGPRSVRTFMRTSDGTEVVVEWWQAPDGEHSRLTTRGIEEIAIEVVNRRDSDETDIVIGEERLTIPGNVSDEDFFHRWREIRTPASWDILKAAEPLAGFGLFPLGAQDIVALFCDSPPSGSPGNERCRSSTRIVEVPRAPDCDFDASVGIPCDDGQWERAIGGGLDMSLDPETTLRAATGRWY